MPDSRVTPMMEQYIEIKAANPDCLLFYRMGDFYELFFEDAEIAEPGARHRADQARQAPGPGHPDVRRAGGAADDYLQRLIGLGHRVAVCEQIEDPAEAKKRGAKSVVRRDVVRLVTPGTITEERLLEPGRANYLLAIARRRVSETQWCYGLAAIDISTGHFALSETDGTGLSAEIARFEPREILVPDVIHDDPELSSFWQRDAAPRSRRSPARASIRPPPSGGSRTISGSRPSTASAPSARPRSRRRAARSSMSRRRRSTAARRSTRPPATPPARRSPSMRRPAPTWN